eukprot:m.1304074 g.1304074  ORF g.1304074 m.1304074 type:complete len:121 (+) comp24810_c0_seq39:1940-2302(+)
MSSACNEKDRLGIAVNEHRSHNRNVGQMAAAGRRMVAQQHVARMDVIAQMLDLEAHGLLHGTEVDGDVWCLPQLGVSRSAHYWPGTRNSSSQTGCVHMVSAMCTDASTKMHHIIRIYRSC